MRLLRNKSKKEFKYYGDEYNDWDEPTDKKEEMKLMIYFMLLVFLPLMLLMIFRYIMGFGLNLAVD